MQIQHHIRIDQLEWGAPTATQGEATLPVKFATVLLRDVNGVINLDVPVSGTLLFGAGETNKTFSVPIIDDILLEGNETIELVLTNLTGNAVPGQMTTVLTIVDNTFI